jgi:hypothetical protein
VSRDGSVTLTIFEVDSPHFLEPRTNSRHFEATSDGITAA